MNWFGIKSTVEKNEENFNTKKMENRDVFHELNIRSGDPELLRTQVLELVEDMGYDVIINKFTKFEDAEFENVFKAGRLKPLRAVLNAEKNIETGSRFPWLWKLAGVIGIILCLVYFVPQSFFDNFSISVSNYYFGIAGIILLLVSLALWLMRRIDTLRIWFKASGIYNVEDNTSDFRIIFSGETTSTEKSVARKLDDDITELFAIISKKYVKQKEAPGKAIIELTKKDKDFDVEVIKDINIIERDLKHLDSRLANGEITEKAYNEAKEGLNDRKRKLETILDLVNV